MYRVQKRRSAPSAAAAPLAVNAAVEVSHLSLGGGEELLELVLEGLVCGGGQRLASPAKGGPGRMRGAGSCRVRGGTGACGAGGCGPLRAESGPLLLRQGLLDGKVDLSVLRGQDQDLDGLPLLQKVMYVVDKGVGDLRNMYQTGPPPSRATNAPNLVIEVTLPSKILPTCGSIWLFVSPSKDFQRAFPKHPF